MTLIKHSQSESAMRSAVVLDLGDLLREGELIKQRARDEAARILTEARQERESLISDASEIGYGEGFERGLADGREQGQIEGRETALRECSEEYASVAARWTASLDEFLNKRNDMLLDAKKDLLSLSIQIARRITHRTITVDPSVVESQLERAIGAAAKSSRLLICVSERDAERVNSILPGVTSKLREGTHAELRSDAELGDGSCIVRTEEGEVDASIATMIDHIAEALLPDDGETRDLPSHDEPDAEST